jgi:hypothetical protein
VHPPGAGPRCIHLVQGQGASTWCRDEVLPQNVGPRSSHMLKGYDPATWNRAKLHPNGRGAMYSHGVWLRCIHQIVGARVQLSSAGSRCIHIVGGQGTVPVQGQGPSTCWYHFVCFLRMTCEQILSLLFTFPISVGTKVFVPYFPKDFVKFSFCYFANSSNKMLGK